MYTLFSVTSINSELLLTVCLEPAPMDKLLGNRLVGTRFASRYRSNPERGFKAH